MSKRNVIEVEAVDLPASLAEKESIRFTRILRALRRGNVSLDDIEELVQEGSRSVKLNIDTNCRSGVFLNIPLVLPGMVLTWSSLHGRVYKVRYVRKDSDRFFFYVCLDDLSLEALSMKPVRIRGFREPEALVPLITAFSILVARMVKTEKPVFFSDRVKLAVMLARSIYSTLKEWVSEVNRGGAGESDESGVQQR